MAQRTFKTHAAEYDLSSDSLTVYLNRVLNEPTDPEECFFARLNFDNMSHSIKSETLVAAEMKMTYPAEVLLAFVKAFDTAYNTSVENHCYSPIDAFVNDIFFTFETL